MSKAATALNVIDSYIINYLISELSVHAGAGSSKSHTALKAAKHFMT